MIPYHLRVDNSAIRQVCYYICSFNGPKVIDCIGSACIRDIMFFTYPPDDILYSFNLISYSGTIKLTTMCPLLPARVSQPSPSTSAKPNTNLNSTIDPVNSAIIPSVSPDRNDDVAKEDEIKEDETKEDAAKVGPGDVTKPQSSTKFISRRVIADPQATSNLKALLNSAVIDEIVTNMAVQVCDVHPLCKVIMYLKDLGKVNLFVVIFLLIIEVTDIHECREQF